MIEQDQLELEVLDWNEYTNSFTMAGGVRPDLDRLIKDVVRIPLLVLTQDDGRRITEIRNVCLKGSHSHYSTPRVQTAGEMSPIEWTEYEYEEIDRA